MNAAQIADSAKLLDDAERECRDVEKLTDRYPELTLSNAYRIQREIIRLRSARGERTAGHKMGLTSHAKMRQMGVNSPIRGFLLASGNVPDGATTSISGLIHPKVEAEIAVVTGRTLSGPGCSLEDALAAIEAIAPAIEIIDSRYRNFRFDLPSVVADNTSAARFVVGADCRPAAGLDLCHLGMVLERNGEVLATGAGAAVLGHPAASLAALVNLLAAEGETLPAGTLVLTGAITEAFVVTKGDIVTVSLQSVGSARVRFN